MKKTSKVAFCGVLTALELVIMLTAYFPYLTYALPAISGCFAIPAVIDVGKKYAWSMYVAVSVLSFFLCEKEAAVFYILFFGFYPILKSLIEMMKSKSVIWIIKLITATAGFAAAYFISTLVLGIDVESLGDFGKYTSLIMLVCYDVIFVIYDLAVSRIVGLYIYKFRKYVRKIIG